MQSEVEANIAYKAFTDICLPIVKAAPSVNVEENYYFDDILLEQDASLSVVYPKSSQDYDPYIKDNWRSKTNFKRYKDKFPQLSMSEGVSLYHGVKLYKEANELPSALMFRAGPTSITVQDEPPYDTSYSGHYCGLEGKVTNIDSVNALKSKLHLIGDEMAFSGRRNWNLFYRGEIVVIKNTDLCSRDKTYNSDLFVRFSHFLISPESVHGEQKFKLSMSTEPCGKLAE